MLSLNFNPFPLLLTKRLVLRQISVDDITEVFTLRSDTTIMQFISRPLAETTADALQLIQKIIDNAAANDGITWAISLQNNTTLIGTIGFWKIDTENHRAEIGYLLHTDYQQKGIMQEAIEAVLTYGFTTMQLHSVEANVNPANEASKKLLDKNNFIMEGYFKENYYFNGQFLDSAVYSLITPIK